jgi:hypothetical protein
LTCKFLFQAFVHLSIYSYYSRKKIQYVTGKKKRSATGEDDTMSKLPKFVDGGVVEQRVLESDNLGPDEPGALFPAMQSRAAVVSQLDQVGGSAIVTPAKSPKQFYLLNKQNGEILKAASYDDAIDLQSKMVRLCGVKVSDLVVEDFKSDSDAKSFLQSITNHPMPGQPADKVCNAIVAINDDIVPVHPIREETSRVSTGLNNLDPRLEAFRAATIGHGTSIDVMRWRLPECRFHAYAFKLMSGRELYWSHKPQMWMLACKTEHITPVPIILPPEENMSIHKALNYMAMLLVFVLFLEEMM